MLGASPKITLLAGQLCSLLSLGHCEALWMISETKLEPLRHNIMTEGALTKLI